MLVNKILQLSIIKKWAEFCKKTLQEIQFQRSLQEMDFQWQRFGGRCWQPFPPFFYYTHTKEEIQRLLDELKEEIEKS